MKVRNAASVPTVISPARTLSPPTSSTSPMAAKKDNVIAAVLSTRMSTRSCARSSARVEAARNFSISCCLRR